tara:strand:+ start:114 stop:257 length:144 start_codon:yes stop_codon:yes gene_type:complete
MGIVNNQIKLYPEESDTGDFFNFEHTSGSSGELRTEYFLDSNYKGRI